MPAKVEGTWQTPQGELTLEQTYPGVKGTLKNGNVIAPVTEGKITGDQIAFTAGGTRYTGTVDGATITGKANTGGKEERLDGEEVGQRNCSCPARPRESGDPAFWIPAFAGIERELVASTPRLNSSACIRCGTSTTPPQGRSPRTPASCRG